MQNPPVQIQINHPKQAVKSGPVGIDQLLQWREESMIASADWRAESWRDQEMYDGNQWSDDDLDKASDAGLPNTLTINHIFPTVNLILGSQIVNKYDMIAKGRTSKDGEIGQVLTEGLKYVMDQWNGEYKITNSFKDSVIPGIGWITPSYCTDPRKERVKVSYRDWKEVWWDPYASPWLETDQCRYVFTQRWMDVVDLQAIFPEKNKDIEYALSDSLQVTTNAGSGSTVMDEASIVEEKVKYTLGTGWVQTDRKRIRPCELWYSVYETGLYAVFPDGNVMEIRPDMDPMEQFQIIRMASEVLTATVKKIRVATFLGNLPLADVPSPYSHDEYPFVPFVGYLDRYNFPYGVPRQLRDQQEEINRRRSMALALLNSRRIVIEEDAPGTEMTIQELYEEANKPDGFLVVSSGSIAKQKIQIVDQAKLMQPQVSLMEQSEREIQQVSGANAERLGYKSNAISGVAIEKRQTQGATVTAGLFENLRRSLSILGNQLVCLIQGAWTGEKVLRITDRLSGAEKYVELNKRIMGQGGISVRNDITQGKFDVVVSDAPITDTIREQNVMMIIEWIKKSPPEIIPQLILVAMEMSNIPNKDEILNKIKPLLGADPLEEDMTTEERKQRTIQRIQSKQAQQSEIEQMQKAIAMLDMKTKEATVQKIMAEVQKIMAEIQHGDDKNAIAQDKNEVQRERIRLEGTTTGFDMQQKLKEGERADREEARGERDSRFDKLERVHNMKQTDKQHDLERNKTAFDQRDRVVTAATEQAQKQFERRMTMFDNNLRAKEMRAKEEATKNTQMGKNPQQETL